MPAESEQAREGRKGRRASHDPGPPEEHLSWREVYRDGGTLLPEMPLVGWARYVEAAPHFTSHTHAAHEVSLLVRGSVNWWAEGAGHEVRRGDLYVTRPGELHGARDAIFQPCELYWIHVRFPDGGRLPGLSAAETRRIAGDFRGLDRCFRALPTIADCFRRLMARHRDRGPYGELLARAALHELLVGVSQSHDDRGRGGRARRAGAAPGSSSGGSSGAGESRPSRVARAVAWMERRPAEPCHVHDVAAAAGMSVSHFHESFVRETGFTPGEFHKRLRIERAVRLLRDGDDSVTAIAHGLGFSTSQYFATAFKHHVGMTPTDCRRRAKATRAWRSAKRTSSEAGGAAGG